MSEDDKRPQAVCLACGGDGQVPDPKLAVLGGVPRTALTLRPCRWCDGEGRRPLRPPV
ncbi:hypothetical protein [Saccharomonospora saliphila]|uniref:hypothetical protein n=1 Tax=Saccharomonospora saliphila TaxID=369829 RepID=UPI0003665234|nr:hypothetical protein [Saccharomonospora saliphila]